MRKVGIIVPTRQRLANAQRLIDHCYGSDQIAATCREQTDIIFAVDEDDEHTYARKLRITPNVRVVTGSRKTCAEWTNLLAKDLASEYQYLASFGDDHAPETPGWDAIMTGVIEEAGGTGIAYGNDTLQGANLPTAPVMSSDIVRELDWMFLPGLIHFFADNVWKDIGEKARCLWYLKDVTIRHYHFMFGTAPVDAVYAEAAPAWQHDEPFYWDWTKRPDGLAADAEKVRRLLARPREVRT